MSPEQYWDQDVQLAPAYRKKHELDYEEKNRFAHLQGLYFYEALCAVSPVLQAFAKAGTKPIPYPEKPYELVYDGGDGKDGKELTSEQKDKQTNKAMQFFQAMATSWNEAYKKSKGETDAGSRSLKTEDIIGQPAGVEGDSGALSGTDGAEDIR